MRRFPMTAAQRRIWFAEQFADVAASYVLDASMWLHGPLDADALETALNKLTEWHPMLQVRVGTSPAGQPEQWLHLAKVSLPRLAATGDDLAERRATAMRLAQAELARPLNVRGGRLFRPALVVVAPDHHLLVFAYHHLVGDGAASRALRRDLMLLYAAEVTREAIAAKTDPDFAEVVASEDAIAAQRGAADLKATLTRLADGPVTSTIPPDYPRPPRLLPSAHWVPLALPPELCQAVTAAATAHGVTPFIVYSAALHLLIQRYARQTDTLVGFMTAHRVRRHRDATGLYAQTLVQRLNCDDNPTSSQLLRRLRGDVLGAADHQHTHLEDLVSALGRAGTTEHHPLFQAMINYIEVGPVLTAGDLVGSAVVVPAPAAWIDLELRLHPHSDGTVEGYLRCPDTLYEAATADRLARHFTSLVGAICAHPNSRVAELPVLDEREHYAVLAAGEGPFVPPTPGLVDLLREQFRRTPQLPALTFAGQELSYRDIATRAGAVAAGLRDRGIGPGSIVAIAGHRCPDLVIGMVGTVLAGAAFAPLDPDQPSARRSLLLADLEPAAVLATAEVLREWSEPRPGLHDIAELSRSTTPAVSPADPMPGPDDLSYVLFTSGSTGAPKGVGNTQQGLANRLDWMQRQYPIGPGDAVLQKTPVFFDVSVWEFFWPLVTGARLVLAEPDGHRDPQYLGRLIRSERITVVHFVPSMLRAFVTAGELAQPLPLRHLICSGEALPWDLCRTVLDTTDIQLHNLYGPTEAAIDVTAYSCREAGLTATVPIGRAAPNTRTLVLDNHLQPVPFGAVGDLYLGGVQLASGYLNRPDLTRERFVDDPRRPGERLYRTGDLARMRPDGLLEFLGRADRQIKVHGVRVEPGEVEAACLRVPGVRQAVALVAPADNALVVFLDAEPTQTEQGVVATLAGQLPEYLLPSRYHLLAGMPLLPTGKVDQATLVQTDADRCRSDLGRPPAAAATSIEHALTDAVRHTLGLPSIGIDDSFFAIGGDSIRSIELVARARRAGYLLRVEDIFGNPTVRQMAAVARPLAEVSSDRVEPFALIDPSVRLALPASAVDAFPLSSALAGLLVESARPARYRIYTTSLLLAGPVNMPRLRAAVHAVVARHPMLRSALWYADSTAVPLCVVHDDVPDPLVVIDLRAQPANQRDADVAGWLEGEQRRAFDWTQPPLVRITVHLFTDDRLRLTIAEPYLDGFSAALVLSEVLTRYREPCDDLPNMVVPGVAEHLVRERAALVESANFWHDYLASAVPSRVPGFDADCAAPVLECVDVAFERETALTLSALNRATGLPMKSLLLAAHVRVLATLTGQTEVTTGLMANARPDGSYGSVAVGLFLNPIPLRIRLNGGTWWHLVEQVHRAEGTTLPHRAYPFAQLRRDHLVDGVDTLFNFTHFHLYRELSGGRSLRVLDRVANDQTYFPLTAQFQLAPDQRSLTLRLEFFGNTVAPATRDAIVELYRSAVRRIAETPHARYDTYPRDDNDPRLVAPSPAHPPQALHLAFAEQAARTPDAVAARGPDGQLTYAELHERAGRLASKLRDAGVAPGDPVAVHLPRSCRLVAVLLGVLAAGGVYLPLDPSLPPQRRAAMLAAANDPVVVSTDPQPTGARSIDPSVVAAEQLPFAHDDPQAAAYLLFTSGSTGTPKAVAVSHHAVHNRLRWQQRHAPLATGDVVAARTPIAFVDSVAELLGPLLAGATVHLVPDRVDHPMDLVDELALAAATRVTMVPTLLAELLRLDVDLAARLPVLKHWVLSGETLSTALAHELLRRIPGVVVDNLYGSTEVAGDVTVYRVRGNETGPTVPIGAPIDGCAATVVDPWGNPVPHGVIGELIVSGANIGIGYWQDPELTAAKFVPPPEGRGEGPAFRTGDLVQSDVAGQLTYAGRLDRQIKIRGVRLEPAEIEAALRQAPGITAAAVAIEAHDGVVRCVAYVVPEPEMAPDPRRLRQFLRDQLPAAAIPEQFAVIDRLPRTASGKVDRRSLPTLARLITQVSPETPATMVERELARLWHDRLGSVSIKRTDDFFELGGNSLHAIMLVAAIRNRTGAELTVADIFDYPTLDKQAELIEERLVAALAPRSS